MSMLGTRRVGAGDTLFARATPSEVELTETYSVDQEISRNPMIEQVGDGTGRIEVSVPYDGRDHFTRQAVADVERVLGPRGGGAEHRATIGHLLISDHTKTDGLRGVMRAHNQAGAIPLTVPVTTRDGNLDLVGDRQTCTIAYDYHPEEPSICPVDLTVDLDDADSLIGDFETVQSLMVQGRDDPSAVIERLRQEASFSSELLLKFVIRISIPVKEGWPGLYPVVRTMSVEWPTLTSLRSTKLFVANVGPHAHGEPEIQDAVVRYNPVKGRLEWEDIRMYARPSGRAELDKSSRVYQSPVLLLKIGHPGELFKEETLEVNARVDIPGYLLSGIEARLFTATGHQRAEQPELVTKLNIRTLVYPADIFAKRAFSPYRQFVFHDIVPDEMRITDIISVLRNSNFECENRRPQAQRDPQVPTWLLLAHRNQGPDSLDLLIAVEGKRARLATRTGFDNQIIDSHRESGQLKVSLLGTFPRDHKELTREMNALQHAMRERFRYAQMSGG